MASQKVAFFGPLKFCQKSAGGALRRYRSTPRFNFRYACPEHVLANENGLTNKFKNGFFTSKKGPARVCVFVFPHLGPSPHS